MTNHSHGFWQLAGKRLLADKVARICGVILISYAPLRDLQRAA